MAAAPLQPNNRSNNLSSNWSQDLVAAAGGGGFVFGGRLFEYAIRFAFGLIVARSLGATGYGQYTLGVTIAILVSTVARFGLSEGMVHFLPRALRRHDEAQVWGTILFGVGLPLLTGLALGAAMWILAPALAEWAFSDPSMGSVLRWISYSVPLITLGRILMAAARGFKYMRYEVYAESFALTLGRFALTLLFLSLGFGLPGVLVAYALAWLGTDGLVVVFLNRLFSLWRPLSTRKINAGELLRFSLPVWLSQIIRQLAGNLELLLLGILSTAASVGVYNVAVRIQAIGLMFMLAAELVAKPIIADLYHQSAQNQLRRIYQTLTRWSLTFILPYFACMVIFARPILSIFGEDFVAGIPVLIIVGFGTLVNAATGICAAMIVMTGHSRLALINSIIALATNLCLNLILIPAWGLFGAAVGAASSITVVSIIRLIQVYKLHGLWPYTPEFIKPLIAFTGALLIGAAASVFLPVDVSPVNLVIDALILYAVYIGGLVLSGLPETDRAVLARAKARIRAAFNAR
jgi:O-antigen/teichoic acid export membrane protein